MKIELILDDIQELVERAKTVPLSGKKVIENIKTPFEGTCLYCGNQVIIYPGDSLEIIGAEPSADQDIF